MIEAELLEDSSFERLLHLILMGDVSEVVATHVIERLPVGNTAMRGR
jgi:hypothetical protein